MAAPKHPNGGRPLKFKTVEELQSKIEEYFEWCDNRTRKIWKEKTQEEMLVADPAPYTMSGLARALDVDRETLLNYAKREQYFGTIRAAREKVHEDVETRLMATKNEKGAIFNLKNNFGWKDKTETDLTTGGDKIESMIIYKPAKKDESMETVPETRKST